MIELTNIYKNYQENKESISILKNISLKFKKPELTFIIGKSGSGKTTLMNILTGIDTASGGQYLLNGENVQHLKDKQWSTIRQKQIGIVFQNYNLIQYLTAVENIEMSLLISGEDKKTRHRKALKLLDQVNMRKWANHKPDQLSGGQQQRIAIARALANNPEVIIADEPTGALDSKNSTEVMQILKKIALSGKIVIVVTHSMEHLELADRIINISDGQVISDKSNLEKNNLKKCSSIIKKKRLKNISVINTFRLFLKNFKSKFTRNVLAAIGMSVSVASILVILFLGAGISNIIMVNVGAYSTDNILEVSHKDNSLLTSEDIEKIRTLEGVRVVYDVSPFSTSLQYDNKQIDVAVSTIAPEQEQKYYKKEMIKWGEFPKSDDEIMISEKNAIKLFGGDGKQGIGKNISMVATIKSNEDLFPSYESNIKVVGIVNDGLIDILTLEGISSELADKILDSNPTTQGSSLFVNVFPKNGTDIKQLKQRIVKLNYEAITPKEDLEKVQTFVQIISIALALIASISLLVSFIMIGLIIYISVIERTREIGILKSLGSTLKDVRRLFTTEGVGLTILGCILGIIEAVCLSCVANIVTKQLLDLNGINLFQYNRTSIFVIFISVSLVAYFASRGPANKAAKQSIITSLNY